MAHFFRLDGEYEFSIADIDNLEEICREIIIEDLKERILSEFGSDYDVEISWVYEGYKIFIMTKLSEEEVEKFVISLDPLKQIGLCKMFWDIQKNKNCTGILLAYDYNHYHRVMNNDHSFVIITMNGVEDFVRRLHAKMSFLQPNLQFIAETDKEFEKKLKMDRLKGVMDADGSMIPKIKGKMHSINKAQRNSFDDYWDKKLKK